MSKIAKKLITIILVFILTQALWSTAFASIAPTQWDSRSFGWVTGVKEQEKGNCWAFALCALAETDAISKGIATQEIDFSENYLSYFKQLMPEVIATSDGGNCSIMMAAISRSNGLGYESQYPAEKSITASDIANNQCEYRITTAKYLYDTDEIKNWVVTHGAVAIGLYLDEKTLPTEKNIYCSDETLVTNHEVIIVGFDDNYSKDNFRTKPQNNGAWICKNSYGEDWGDNGYFYLSYEDAVPKQYFGINVEKSGIYNAHNYNIDNQFATYYSEYPENDLYGLFYGNVFQVKAREHLTGFSYITIMGKNSDVHVYFSENYTEKMLTEMDFDFIDVYSTSATPVKRTEYEYHTHNFDYTAPSDGYIFILISSEEPMKSIQCHGTAENTEKLSSIWGYYSYRLDKPSIGFDFAGEYNSTFYIQLFSENKSNSQAEFTETTQETVTEKTTVKELDKTEQTKASLSDLLPNKKQSAELIGCLICLGVIILIGKRSKRN